MAVVVVDHGSSGGPPGVDPYTAIDDDGNTPDSGIRGSGGDGLFTQIASAPPGGVGGGGGGAGGNGADGVNPSSGHSGWIVVSLVKVD